MMLDPGIVCFQHCGPKVFCRQLPERCPSCHCGLIDTVFKLPPFRLPYPFVKASQYPCSIIIRPTKGDFLNDYFNSTDLHIGVTTSTGSIVEFDYCGLCRHTDKMGSGPWSQSLLVETVPEAWMDHWDEQLHKICKQGVWTSAAYREDSHNCYSFVLSFLQALGYGSLSKAAENRTLFCEQFIVPRTTAAGKYISLYRKIRDNGHYVHPPASDGTVGAAAALTGGKLYSIKE